MSFKSLVRKYNYRPFKSPDDYWRKRVRFGQLNSFFGHQIISADGAGHTLPFLSNPFRETREKDKHVGRDDAFTQNMLEAYDYDLSPDARAGNALKTFDVAYNLVKDRVPKDSLVCDIGCASGHHLQSFHEKGYQNLWGLDPVESVIEYGRKTRPYINFRIGHFGPRENDVICDLMTWFGVISRIPYSEGLFETIDRCATKYVLIAGIQEAADDFVRDYHCEMGKIGFMCIEKRVFVGEESTTDQVASFKPIGTPGADGPLLELGDRQSGKEARRLFRSFFLFRRITPRPRAASKN